MQFKRIIRKAIIFMIFIILFSMIIYFFREFIANYFVKFNLSSIDVPPSNAKVLIFSPHNDDEILSSADLIRKTLFNGGTVKVVFMTNGDGFKDAIMLDYHKIKPKTSDYINFGYERQKESVNALKSLGLTEDNIIFLGYPDGGLSSLWNTNWDSKNPYTSIYTKTNMTPYADSYTKNSPFSGESVVSDISKVINEYKPTYIVYPHPNDRHPDHWATNCFVKYVLTSLNYRPQEEFLYLVHRGDWPTPMRKERNMYLVPPAKLINMGTQWVALDMAQDDIAKKADATNQYKSQLGTIGLFLSSFERQNELFGIYPNGALASNLNADENIKPSTANCVITDPLKDALSLVISKDSDISNVYAEMSTNKNLHIFLETTSEIEQTTDYQIDMIFFGSSTKRLTLEFKNNKVTAKELSSQSVTKTANIQSKIQGKFLHIIISGASLDNFNEVYINASSSIRNITIDKTAWRMLEAPNTIIH